MRGGRSADELASTWTIAGAVFGVFASGVGLVQAVGGPAWLQRGFAAIALVGAVVAVVFHWLERR